MFLVLGSKTKNFRGDDIMDEVCPSCGYTQHNVHGFTKYLHFFWLPFVPWKRGFSLVCGKCQFSRTDKDLPPQVTHKLKSRLFSLVKLAPYFLGWFIFGALGFFLEWDTQKNREQRLGLVEFPMVGDVYEFKSQKTGPGTERGNRFFLLKVVEVRESGVKLVRGNISYESWKGTNDALENGENNRDHYFNDKRRAVTDSTLVDWVKSGAIFDVIRKAEGDMPTTD